MKNTKQGESISQASDFCSIEYQRINSTEGYSRFSKCIQDDRILDIIALTELVSWNTFIGDRTIDKNIKRRNWTLKSNEKNNYTNILSIIKHGTKSDTTYNISQGLHKLLKEEIAGYVKNSHSVGILLSGGMDSRIVAGILKQIQNERNGFDVTAFCWGIRPSRDPVYAEKIALMYKWQYEHFAITPTTLKRNIELAADMGCFFAPQHLHAMPDIAKRAVTLGIDCILAGSYGDSIGRGEYSGNKVMQLKPVKSCLGDPFGLINKSLYKECKIQTLKEIDRYHQLYETKNKWAINEIDYQIHYMRNQLNTCMSVISWYIPLYQCFTSTEVVKYMWSYHPDYRTDEVYLHLVKSIDRKLYEIPWARTGKRYLSTNDTPDNLGKAYHKYGEWVRKELSGYIESLIFNGEIEATNIYNMKQLKYMYKVNKANMAMMSKKLDEIVLWLATLAIYLKKNKVTVDKNISSSNIRSLRGTVYLLIYSAWQKLKLSKKKT